MTATPHLDNAVSTALSLCIGTGADLPDTSNWPQVYTAAHAERLAVLAWLRNGDSIRRNAPPEIVAKWRAEVVAADEVARLQLRELHVLARALSPGGDRVFVLKGLPLAARLYGDIAARACCDIDVYAPLPDRRRVHRLLVSAGWHHWFGEAPFDASYRKECEGSTVFLEIHSAMTGEPLSHCSIPVAGDSVWTHGDVSVATLDGAELAVYLAANIAKHSLPPLLSFLDLATTWARLDASSQTESADLARRGGLARCLEWAVRRAQAVNAAAAGQRDALNLLGVSTDQRRFLHAYLRLAMLADTPMDASRVIGAWLWPRSLRGARGSLPAFWGRRLGRPLSRRLAYARTYGDDHGS